MNTDMLADTLKMHRNEIDECAEFHTNKVPTMLFGLALAIAWIMALGASV